MHSFSDLYELFCVYITHPEHRDLIKRAYELAANLHKEQFRRSGEPYIQHPLEVAYITAELCCGPVTIAAALLHDVVEDTPETIEGIREKFGDEVAKIVDALTKIQRMKLSKMQSVDFDAEDHRRILLGMAQDVRVIIIKLADRLHNLRTLDSLSPERQIALSKETLDVFTPIAHRLGMYTVQSEMEDLCLKHLEPEKYRHIQQLVEERIAHKQSSLSNLTKRLADVLLANNIPLEGIESRVKSISSIYKKMYMKNHSFDEIYDILALRIITKTKQNCYEILGIVHEMYTPLLGRFKDYIAQPKPNGYQSLHTSILAGDGQIYEVQIRTKEMDDSAERGVAAHWHYKEGNYNPREEQKQIEENLHWFRDFVAFSENNQTSDAREYIATLTSDIFLANVSVFTPKGEVIVLPTGATTLDFAYKIHTRVGDTAVGAVVNGILVPLSTVLRNGDVCEIRTNKKSSPNDSWLEIAKTASAKAHIRKALQAKDAEIMREERIKSGRQSLVDAFKVRGYTEEEGFKLLDDPRIRNEYHCESIDDLCVMVAGKNPTAAAVLDTIRVKAKVTAPLIRASKRQSKKPDDGYPVRISGGMTGLAIALAHCCTPIPGDDIVGYITKGKGITIHRRSCPNIAHEHKRLLDVAWKDDIGLSTYPVDVEVYANNRNGLVAEVLQTFAAKGVNVSDLNAHLNNDTQNVVVSLKIFVTDSKVLQDCFADLMGLRAVYSVVRVIH